MTTNPGESQPPSEYTASPHVAKADPTDFRGAKAIAAAIAIGIITWDFMLVMARIRRGKPLEGVRRSHGDQPHPGVERLG
jgi:hypothetical protein